MTACESDRIDLTAVISFLSGVEGAYRSIGAGYIGAPGCGCILPSARLPICPDLLMPVFARGMRESLKMLLKGRMPGTRGTWHVMKKLFVNQQRKLSC